MQLRPLRAAARPAGVAEGSVTAAGELTAHHVPGGRWSRRRGPVLHAAPCGAGCAGVGGGCEATTAAKVQGERTGCARICSTEAAWPGAPSASAPASAARSGTASGAATSSPNMPTAAACSARRKPASSAPGDVTSPIAAYSSGHVSRTCNTNASASLAGRSVHSVMCSTAAEKPGWWVGTGRGSGGAGIMAASSCSGCCSCCAGCGCRSTAASAAGVGAPGCAPACCGTPAARALPPGGALPTTKPAGTPPCLSPSTKPRPARTPPGRAP